jgi:hypothetical protein
MSEPVNVASRRWLWRFEGKVLGTALRVALIAVWAIVQALFGRDGGQVVIDVVGNCLILALPVLLIWWLSGSCTRKLVFGMRIRPLIVTWPLSTPTAEPLETRILAVPARVPGLYVRRQVHETQISYC